MKINKIQNEQAFGTRVEISKNIQNFYKRKGAGYALKEFIKDLENNGNADTLVLTEYMNTYLKRDMVAKVFQQRKNGTYTGTTVVRTLSEDTGKICPNIQAIYNQAKAGMHLIDENGGIFGK